jgi:hypothetical protein
VEAGSQPDVEGDCQRKRGRRCLEKPGIDYNWKVESLS